MLIVRLHSFYGLRNLWRDWHGFCEEFKFLVSEFLWGFSEACGSILDWNLGDYRPNRCESCLSIEPKLSEDMLYRIDSVVMTKDSLGDMDGTVLVVVSGSGLG